MMTSVFGFYSVYRNLPVWKVFLGSRRARWQRPAVFRSVGYVLCPLGAQRGMH